MMEDLDTIKKTNMGNNHIEEMTSSDSGWVKLQNVKVLNNSLMKTTNTGTIKFIEMDSLGSNGNYTIFSIEDAPKELTNYVANLYGTKNVYIGVKDGDPELQAYIWKY